jgi:type IV secretory pathway VirB10-like protein
MKEQIKSIIVIVGTILIIFAIIIAVVFITDDDDNTSLEELQFVETKFPLTAYMHTPKKNDKDYNASKLIYQEVKTQPKQKKENTLSNQVDNFKSTFKTQKYDMKVFESQDDIEKKKLEEQRQLVLAARINSTTFREPKNNFKNHNKSEKEFGDSKFSNYKKQNSSSYQTKLYRAITADKMIPLTLINSITSTLSGKVVAQVEDDIYASMGKALLIPKGSKAIGFYVAGNKMGENRFPLIWERIITPHGHNILLTKSQTADIIGNSGIVGVVDNRYWERYGLPLTLSTLSNSLLLLVSQATDNGNNNTQMILDNSRQDISYIMKNIINEQIKIGQKVTIEKGSRIFINPTVDIWFPIPKDDNSILVQYYDEKEVNLNKRENEK